eukprot:gene34534-41814_t
MLLLRATTNPNLALVDMLGLYADVQSFAPSAVSVFNQDPFTLFHEGSFFIDGAAGPFLKFPSSSSFSFNWGSEGITIDAWIRCTDVSNTLPAFIGLFDTVSGTNYWSFGPRRQNDNTFRLQLPTVAPSIAPSEVPTVVPTVRPSEVPTATPSVTPSVRPSVVPSGSPSLSPTVAPSIAPSEVPTVVPTATPSVTPSLQPSSQPSLHPSSGPTAQPSSNPTVDISSLGSILYTPKFRSSNTGSFLLQVCGSLFVWGDTKCGGSLTSTRVSSYVGEYGVVKVVSSSAAFAALLGNGGIIAWGSDTQTKGWEKYLEPEKDTDRMVDVVANNQAYAALTRSGRVICFGVSTMGGNLPDSSSFQEALSAGVVGLVAASAGAFAAVKEDGSVYSWGIRHLGGEQSPESSLSKLTRIRQVVASEGAFVGQRADGSFVTWGNCYYGGCVSASQAGFRLGLILASSMAFVGITTDRQIMAWGRAQMGGMVPPSIASYVRESVDKVDYMVSTQGAIALLVNDNSSVLCWGSASHGGNCSNLFADLQPAEKVTSMVSSEAAFAILTSFGRVLAWGAADKGGNMSDSVQVQLLSGVVQLVSSRKAFAVLKDDESVVAWGDDNTGGDSSRVSALLSSDVVFLLSGEAGFLAIKRDGQVVGWGDEASISQPGYQLPSVPPECVPIMS